MKDRAKVADVETAARKLLAYCQQHNWAGHDPYDALNSRLLSILPALDSRIPRLILTQVLKRSPVDMRRLLQIPETQNAKGISLFLARVLKAPELVARGAADIVGSLEETLVRLRSQDSN